MGRMQHHAIITTFHRKDHLEKIMDFIKDSPLPFLFSICPQGMNGLWSAVMFPDCSQEAWPDSDIGDDERDRFIEFLKEKGPSTWIEVSYGDDGESITRCP